MRIIDITHPPKSLWIGRESENTFRPVSFECANWFSSYPNATIAAYYQPYGVSEPYPLYLTVDGTKRIWNPLAAELVKGDGELQIVLMNGDTVGTSAIIPTEVDRSLISNADHPASEAPPWAVKVVEDVAAEADRAEEAVASIDSKVETSVNEKLPEAVEDYFDEHPVVADETDPTVPAWAKQPTKPTYTAQEVGALPNDTVIPDISGKVDKVAGKGLSTNDFTNADKSKLDGIEAGAQKNAVDSVNGKTGQVTLDASDVHALPDNTVIPPTVTEQTVAGWGFTKNTGNYSKPSGGIPASDLAAGVIPAVPSASATAPLMDGMAAAGSSAAYARGDHVHPSDTTKLDTTGNAYRSASIPMGHLDATSTATVMTATVDGITELRDGVCMWLQNGVITSASGFTLNVNGLGARPCYSSLAAESRSTTIFNVNYTMLFVYNSTRVDGGCWDIVYGVDTNTTYTPPKLGFGYGTCTTAAATAAKTASISSYALNTGGIVSIKFDNDVPSGATLNISSKGAKAIYHRGAAITADVIKAGDVATFIYSTYYHLISIDRSESAPIQTIKVNGTALTPDANKAVDVPVTTKTSELENDSGFINAAGAAAAAPVQSVNGKTGPVVLKTSDIENDSGYVPASAIVTEGNTVIDNTLSVPGAAADAKVVGDTLFDIDYRDIETVDGFYIDSTNGNAVSTSVWAYKTFNVVGLDGETATIHTKLVSGSVAGWAVILKDGSYHSGGTDADATITLPENVGVVKVCCVKSNFSVNDIAFNCNYSKQLALKSNTPDISAVYSTTEYAYKDHKSDFAGGYLDENGNLVATSTFKTTGFIDVYAHTEVFYKLSMYNGVRYAAFYDENKNFISSVVADVTSGWASMYVNGSLNIPENAKYFRVTFRTNVDSLFNEQSITIRNNRIEVVSDEFKKIAGKSPEFRILILGDSYSTNPEKWINQMMDEFSEESSYVSLAVTSATIKDQSTDRTTYPYTSRPSSSNTVPNTNTLGCQIAKLKRLMAGVDLDDGESAIYQNEAEYPNVVIIQGGENEGKDSSTSAYNDQFEVKAENAYYSRWGNTAQGTVYLKPDVNTVDRTIFAGAYRYLMEELYSLFPKAQFFFATTSPVSTHQNPVLSIRREIAEQQKLCANMCCVSVIDWQAESQMSIITNSVVSGNGTQENPYNVAPATLDSNDGLHPTPYGGKKLGKLAASVIKSKFMALS